MTTQDETPVLTNIQKDTLRMIGEGKRHREIAVEFGITERTAKARCDSLRMKFAARSMRDLIPIARSYKL
jgi:DNA-binding CsgD family transcriptional regulator